MKWLTIQEAAKFFGVCQATILRRIKDGTLPSKYADGRWWVLKEDHDLKEDLLNLLKPVARLDPQKILSDLEIDLGTLDAHHSSVAAINGKIIEFINSPIWEDDYEINHWYPWRGKITSCQEAIRQMRQSGRLNTNMIHDISKILQDLRNHWSKYHQRILEKYNRLRPSIIINPSRQGMVVLNQILTQLEELRKLI